MFSILVQLFNKKSLQFSVGIIIYRVLLDKIYTDSIVPFFSYMGFDNNGNFWSSIYSWVILFLLLFIILKITKLGKISSDITTMLFILAFVPTTSLLKFMPINIHYVTLISLYWTLLFVGYFFVPTINFGSKKIIRSDAILNLIAIFLCLVIIYVSGRYFNFRIHLSFLDVYDLRAEERDLALPLPFRYLISIAGTVLPVLTAYYLYRKRFTYAIFIIFILLLDFSIGGHKSVFLKTVISIIGVFFYKYFRVVYLPWIMSVITAVAILEQKIIGTFYIITFFIRRGLFIPALLNNFYYDYFSRHEADFLKQGILRWVGFNSIYKVPIPRIIGDNYFGQSETNANNGLFSDAYTNFNVIGVLFYPFILLSIIKFFDFTVKGLDYRLYILPVTVFTLSIISTSFSTTLLTNGILVLFFVLYFMKRNVIVVK
jgi:hypothetical protein